MDSLLDAFPYPWPRPDAQQLHLTLTQLYPSGAQAAALAERAGLSAGLVFTEQSAYDAWTDILGEVPKHGLLRPLVQQAHDRLAPTSPARPFLAGLLAGSPPRLAAEVDGLGASGGFLHADDAVSEQEALLYTDDLTIFTNQLPGLITTLGTLAALAPAVCRLTVEFDNGSQYGTAFRIGADLLLTNWHVLHDIRSRQRAAAVIAEFGYETDGPASASRAIVCDVSSIQANEANDWAIIRSVEALADEWPIILLQRLERPRLRSATYIIQHPGGNAKRLGYVRNQVSYVNDRVVQYLTDTQGGSSGAPVFNEAGEVIAVHHLGGRPHTLLGKAPLKKNEGILVTRILDDFAEYDIILTDNGLLHK